MSIEESKSQVRTFISKAKTDEALKVIEAWVNAYGSNEAQIASDMLKSQWTDLAREIRMGFAENVGQRTASINYRILSFNWDVKIEVVEPTLVPVTAPPLIKQEPQFGVILYSIPSKMQLGNLHPCIIRVAFDK